MADTPILATNIGTNVFQRGKFTCNTKPWAVEAEGKPVLIFSPIVPGTYPVILFCHGYALSIYHYSKLLYHITSHGFIVVAPILVDLIISEQHEVNTEGEIAKWIQDELQTKINEKIKEKVEAKLDTIVLAGHSRGGKSAFALALGLTTKPKPEPDLKFSALIGIDPVEGLDPRILTGQAQSFNLNIPIIVIGTGLGPIAKMFHKACAPKGENHEEFFYECKPPCAHFVVRDYGHMDMLDDESKEFLAWFCTEGTGSKDLMIETTGGLVVAFLNAYLNKDDEDFKAIVKDPNLAPAKLDDPVWHQ